MKAKFYVDETFFDVINNEEKAYWLGFVTGDGSIDKSETSLFLGLATKDKNHIEKFKNVIQYEGNIKDYVIKRGEKEFYMSQIRVCRKTIVESLKKHGLHNRKSLTIKPSQLVPFDLQRHYWRGIVDANGTIYQDKRKTYGVMLTGSEFLCQGFLDFVLTSGIKTIAKPRGKVKIKQITFGGSSLGVKVVNLLYRDSSVHLDRKKVLAGKVMNGEPINKNFISIMAS